MNNRQSSRKSLLISLMVGVILLAGLAVTGIWLARSFLRDGEQTIALPAENAPPAAMAGAPVATTVEIGGTIHDESGADFRGKRESGMVRRCTRAAAG